MFPLLNLLLMMTFPNTATFPVTSGSTTSLEYSVRPANSDVDHPPLLILLHGVGSNEEGLYQLSGQLDPDYLIVSVRAPFQQGQGRYKWYDVDFSTGKPVIDFAQAEESRRILIQFIEELKVKHDFDEDCVLVGGFSQGAIMSYSLGLTQPEQVAGIVALSGRMLEEIKPMVVATQQLKELQALVIHGTKDHVLPVPYARAGKAFLETHQISTSYHELDMGHTITPEVVVLLNRWLQRLKSNS